MMKFLWVVCLLLGANAFAGEPVTVFGLPIGGQLSAEPGLCRSFTAPPQHVCWVGKPFRADGGLRIGRVMIPDMDAVPQWASRGDFDAQIKQDRTLQKLEIRLGDGREERNIIDSISMRFGDPVRLDVASRGTIADWHTKDLHVEMMCSPRFCSVSVWSIAAYADLQRELAARRLKESTRRLMP